MGKNNGGPETSHEQRIHHKMQLIYTRKTHERQIFMDELKIIRKQRERAIMKTIKTSIGPVWYQTLSITQRNALDTLDMSIYQDILEDRPVRTTQVIKLLGIFPRPTCSVLMECIKEGQNDSKVMLAHFFYLCYGHPIDAKRQTYNLNARIIMSSIYYLGLEKLKASLREIFRPDKEEKKPPPKRKASNEKPPVSPYLQKMVAALYLPRSKKRPPPAPLPNLDSLNDEPLEEELLVQKPPPPPPPPPPPKKRIPISYCAKLADYQPVTIKPQQEDIKKSMVVRRTRAKNTVTETKKTYGIGQTFPRPTGSKRKKIFIPSTGIWNAQYTICGVFTVRGKSVYVLGNVSILPAAGTLIHGGYKCQNGRYINIHCGFKGSTPPPKPQPCDCLKKWQDVVFEYVRKTKCYCGHHFDYKNEGTFPPDELPFFQKATKNSPYSFNYSNIFNLDPKKIHIDKEFKTIWDTDSMLRVDDGTVKVVKKKKKTNTSKTCLGQNPQPSDYLKCAIRLLKKQNVAARLPDIHLAPELKEWMRYRLYGPFSEAQKHDMLRKSNHFWQILHTLELKGLGHVSPPNNELFLGHTNWVHKQKLNDAFKIFTRDYKLKLFRSYAYVTNLMWPTMFQAELPDKKFREIFFSYLYPRMEDLHIMHPYSIFETSMRTTVIAKSRYICKPAGAENLEH